ncbi:transmembrane protein 115-like isoform X1 [Lampetra fluviatilis]
MRHVPSARQHCLELAAGSSVVVKALCATVVLLYLLSYATHTAYALAVTPGYLIPPMLWVWTPLTCSLVELHAWEAAASVATVALAGRLLEPLWGALELLTFLAVVGTGTGVLACAAYLALYVATFNLDYLFSVQVRGCAGLAGGVLAALVQTRPDAAALLPLRSPPRLLLRLRHAPAAVLAALGLAALLAPSLVSGRPALCFACGLLSGWAYLRFCQSHARGRGDMSEHFELAVFFPGPARPAVALLARLAHGAMVRLGLCGRAVKRYDVGAPSAITISLHGADPHDAERRRQLALKALNERLKRGDEHANWPDMDDDGDQSSDDERTMAPASGGGGAGGTGAGFSDSPDIVGQAGQPALTVKA